MEIWLKQYLGLGLDIVNISTLVNDATKHLSQQNLLRVARSLADEASHDLITITDKINQQIKAVAVL